MNHDIFIRPAVGSDSRDMAQIAETSGLFPADLLPDMIAPFLSQSEPNHIWLVALEGEDLLAFLYCEPERMTVGTANMLALATRSDQRSRGIGARLVKGLEEACRTRGDRLLLVETSGLPEFDRTRAFYEREGYERIATLPEFYDAGEDKVVFMKRLN